MSLISSSRWSPCRVSHQLWPVHLPAVAPSNCTAHRGNTTTHEWLHWSGLSEHTCHHILGHLKSHCSCLSLHISTSVLLWTGPAVPSDSTQWFLYALYQTTWPNPHENIGWWSVLASTRFVWAVQLFCSAWLCFPTHASGAGAGSPWRRGQTELLLCALQGLMSSLGAHSTGGTSQCENRTERCFPVFLKYATTVCNLAGKNT